MFFYNWMKSVNISIFSFCPIFPFFILFGVKKGKTEGFFPR